MRFFSKNNLPIIKDGTFVINLEDKKSKETHWVALSVDRNTDVSFGSFGIEYIPQEVLSRIRDKSITSNIFRIQDDECIMWGFYCIAFIKYMLARKTLLNCTNSFIIKIIYKYFKNKYIRKSKSWV